MKSLKRLDELASDPAFKQTGWDSYGASPLDDRAVEAVRRFLLYEWDIVLCNDGGLQLEKHHSDCDIEVEFSQEGTITSIFARPAE